MDSGNCSAIAPDGRGYLLKCNYGIRNYNIILLCSDSLSVLLF